MGLGFTGVGQPGLVLVPDCLPRTWAGRSLVTLCVGALNWTGVGCARSLCDRLVTLCVCVLNGTGVTRTGSWCDRLCRFCSLSAHSRLLCDDG